MLISFIFSYSEKFFVVFYSSFYFVLGQSPSARDTRVVASGVPKVKWDKITIGGAHKWAEMLHHACIVGGGQREGGKSTIGGAHNWAEMLHHPCILGDPQCKGDKIRIGAAHKWAQMLYHPCILGGPQSQGGESAALGR